MKRRPFLLLLGFALAMSSFRSSLQAQPPRGRANQEEAGDVLKRVVPVFDPGSHTRSITALGFSADDSKLISVGEDATIQIWRVATGERLDILRLASYGHEAGFNGKDWDVAAISKDGRFVAIGGGVKQTTSEGNRPFRTKLLVVDLQKRSIRPVVSPPRGVVTALAFSDDFRLAAAFGRAPQEIIIFPSVAANEGPIRQLDAMILKDEQSTVSPWIIGFSPDGKRLFTTAGIQDFLIWNLESKPQVTKRLDLEGVTGAATWSPDGKQFARAWTNFKSERHGLEIRDAEGELVKSFPFENFPPFVRKSHVGAIHYTAPGTLLIAADDFHDQQSPHTSVIRFDVATGKGEKIVAEETVGAFAVTGAVSHDGRMGALSVSMGLNTLVYRQGKGKIVSRCGAASPVPTLVGWSRAGIPNRFAWSEQPKKGRTNTSVEDLQFGFDLATIEPIAHIRPGNFTFGRLKVDDWEVKPVASNAFEASKAGGAPVLFQGGNTISAATLIPRNDGLPLFAWAERIEHKGRGGFHIAKADGTGDVRMLPFAIHSRDMAPSPDGRYLIVSTGSHRLSVYATDNPQFPLLSFARVNGEWVAWSSEGYYAASPGGEKMFGWAVSNGPDEFSTFYPAEKFARHFRRPDLLAKAIELGSLEKALKATNTTLEIRSPDIEKLAATTCSLKLLKQTGAKANVEARSAEIVQGKPLTEMRLLLDGRPLTAGRARKEIKPGETPVATWEVDLPPGECELKVLVRSEEGSAVSAPITLTAPKSANQQPTIHRLCVGINQYDVEGLRLSAATRDATEVFTAIQEYCVGPNNRFGKAEGQLITDQAATRKAVLDALEAIRAKSKPGELVLFMFAGHGLKQGEEYYLLTKEGDPSKSLEGASLSGKDLRNALSAMECPVLLVLDACHSANGIKFRPATDDLTRGVTDESTGVTVLAAAMQNEVATANRENGYFTAAFIKALKGGEGVPFDPYDHTLYTHHIYSVIFSEVRKATNGLQNPFLNMPWTMKPLVLREMPRP